MRKLLLVGALAALTAAPAGAQVYGRSGWGGGYPGDSYGPGIGAQLWVEGDREEFRRGDRMRVGFSTSADAFVAVLHIDTDGRLEFLYPTNPLDDGRVRGGREYWLPERGYNRGLAVRGSSGIGYLYVVASPIPLDFSYFQRSGIGRWDWQLAGNVVRGDPFWALDQITRTLIPEWGYVPYGVDHYTYYVGGRHSYPSYACSDRYDSRGWGWSSSFSSCDRLDGFLSANPYYYDTRRYDGDRRAYLRELEERTPDHRYKAPVGEGPPVRGYSRSQPTTRPGGLQIAPSQRGMNPVRQPARGIPVRPRPVLERRPDRDTVGGVSAPARGRTGGGEPARTRPVPTRRGGGGGSGD